MINRIFSAAQGFAASTDNQSSAFATFARDTASGFVTTVHHTFMILGLSAIGALALMFVRPDVADQLKAMSPFSTAIAQESVQPAGSVPNLTVSPAAAVAAGLQAAPEKADLHAGHAASTPSSALPKTAEKPSPATQKQQALVTNWLAKKYRVASDATDMLVSAAYGTAKEIKLDPLLILSVMAIESGFNPFAESPVGAQGLMQVMSKVHHEKFQGLGGVKAALNPVANIKVGSLILKDYVTRGGSVEAGLKLYVGAAAFDTDMGYGSKVLAEYRRLKDVSTGKNVPLVGPTFAAKAKPVERNVTPAAAPASIEPPASTPIDPVAENRGNVAAL